MNAVITHFGQTAYEGRYYTTLFQNGRWIYINDKKISNPKNDAPKMRYLFLNLYQKLIQEIESATGETDSEGVMETNFEKNNIPLGDASQIQRGELKKKILKI